MPVIEFKIDEPDRINYKIDEKYAIARKVFAEMAGGKSFNKACLELGLTHATVMNWWRREIKNPTPEYVEMQEVLANEYEDARRCMLEAIVEETMAIADDSTRDTYIVRDDDGEPVELRLDRDNVNRSKLQVETRKWLLSKLAPELYGDSLKLTGDAEKPLRWSVAIVDPKNPEANPHQPRQIEGQQKCLESKSQGNSPQS